MKTKISYLELYLVQNKGFYFLFFLYGFLLSVQCEGLDSLAPSSTEQLPKQKSKLHCHCTVYIAELYFSEL